MQGHALRKWSALNMAMQGSCGCTVNMRPSITPKPTARMCGRVWFEYLVFPSAELFEHCGCRKIVTRFSILLKDLKNITCSTISSFENLKSTPKATKHSYIIWKRARTVFCYSVLPCSQLLTFVFDGQNALLYLNTGQIVWYKHRIIGIEIGTVALSSLSFIARSPAMSPVLSRWYRVPSGGWPGRLDDHVLLPSALRLFSKWIFLRHSVAYARVNSTTYMSTS